MCRENCPMQKRYEGIGDQMFWSALHVQSFLHGATIEVWAMQQIPEHRLCLSLKTRFKKTTRWVLYSCLPQRKSSSYDQHKNNLIFSYQVHQSLLEMEILYWIFIFFCHNSQTIYPRSGQMALFATLWSLIMTISPTLSCYMGKHA